MGWWWREEGGGRLNSWGVVRLKGKGWKEKGVLFVRSQTDGWARGEGVGRKQMVKTVIEFTVVFPWVLHCCHQTNRGGILRSREDELRKHFDKNVFIKNKAGL